MRSRCVRTSKMGKHKHLHLKSLGKILECLKCVEHWVDLSLFIETNVYLKFIPWDYFSKLSCLDSLNISDSSLEKSITSTLLGVVGAFGIAPCASNTLPYSFLLMYSPQLCKNTHFFHGSLCNITLLDLWWEN